MGPDKRMAQHCEAARPGIGLLPVLQPLLVEIAGQPAAKRGQPAAHLVLWPALDWHIQQSRPPRSHPAGHPRPAPGFEIRRPAKIEPVQPGQPRGHFGRIGHQRFKRFGVLLLHPVVQRFQPARNAQERGQPVQNLQIADIVISDVERGLAGGLQPAQDLHLECLQRLDMGGEFRCVKMRQRLAPAPCIAQLPLARRPRDLERDIAFQRVARQHDLGAAPVGQAARQNPRIVIMKEPKARKPPGRGLHRLHEGKGIVIAPCQGYAQIVGAILLADEHRVERLAMAGDAGQGVQVRFQKVRPRAHVGQHDEPVKGPCVGLGHRITSPDRGGHVGRARVSDPRPRGCPRPWSAACPDCADPARSARIRSGRPATGLRPADAGHWG